MEPRLKTHRIMAIPMILSGPQGRAPNVGLLECDFFVHQLTRFQLIARRAVPLRWLIVLFCLE